MCRVTRVSERFKEFAVAVNPSHILGRAGTGTGHAAWILRAILRRKNSLNDEGVLPVVPEIIVVPETKTIAGNDLAKLRGSLILGGIVRAEICAWFPHFVRIVANKELMQVRIRPAHRLLHDPVELE